MNYFELFDLPVSLNVNTAELKKKYFALQQKFHPDFFAQAGDEEQQEALEKSSSSNKAYRIFQDQDLIIKYVLQLKGLIGEEEKYQLPQDFLMEMLDLNDAVAEAKMDEDPKATEKIKDSISSAEALIYEPVKEIIENYKEGVTTEKELLQVKEYYYKKKYLNRILEGLA